MARLNSCSLSSMWFADDEFLLLKINMEFHFSKRAETASERRDIMCSSESEFPKIPRVNKHEAEPTTSAAARIDVIFDELF